MPQIESIYDWPIGDAEARTAWERLHAEREAEERRHEIAMRAIEERLEHVQETCSDAAHKARREDHRPYYCPSCDRQLR